MYTIKRRLGFSPAKPKKIKHIAGLKAQPTVFNNACLKKLSDRHSIFPNPSNHTLPPHRNIIFPHRLGKLVEQAGVGLQAPAAAGVQFTLRFAVAVEEMHRNAVGAAVFGSVLIEQGEGFADVVFGLEVEGEAAGVLFAGALQRHHAVGEHAQAVAAAVIVAADFAFHNQHLVGFEQVLALFQGGAGDHHFDFAGLVFEVDKKQPPAFAQHTAHAGGQTFNLKKVVSHHARRYLY